MLSILIVNWNTRDLLSHCLASLVQYPAGPNDEIIVVDNASTDGSASMVREHFPRARLIEADRNLGYAAGNNMAFRAARGDWLLTLNPDTEVFADTLGIAIDRLRVHPDYGALGARQIDPYGDTQASVRGFPSLRGILGDVTGLGERWPGSPWDAYRLTGFDYDVEQPAPQPMGTFLLFRRDALAAVGDVGAPFDERFPIFFNEVDLLYRLRLAGWPCLYSPHVRVLHHGGASTRQVRKPMIWESHRSLVRFFEKHHRTPANAPLIAGFALLLYLAAFLRARGYHGGFRP